MIIYSQIEKQMMQASSGGCSVEQTMTRVNEVIPLLMGKLYFVGTVAEISVQTFVPEFSLPFGFERAISVDQSECGDFKQGWYTVENTAAYIDPAMWGDSVLLDLGERATERPFIGPAQLIVQSDYNEDAGLTLRLYGSLAGQTVYQQIEQDGILIPQNYHDIPIGPSATDSFTTADFYDAISAIIKPITKGPVRVLAKDQNSGRIYRLITLQPTETNVARRWYKFPELVIQKIIPRGIYPTDAGFQVDTNFEQAPLCVGDSIVLSGWCPTQFNGLWTVSGVVGSSFYVTAGIRSGWTNPGEAISKVGCCTKLACMSISATRQFIPIVDGNSEVIIQNTLALKMGVRAMWAWDSGNVDGPQGYTTLLSNAVTMLTEDVTRYGLDPTNTLKRKASYRFDVDNYAPSTFGYVRGRLGIELVGALRVGKSDLGRLINEAQELAITSGKYGNTTVQRRYEVGGDHQIVLHPDVESLLAFSVNGRPGIVGDKYWKAVTRQNVGTRQSSYVGGPFFAMSTLAGAGWIEPTLVPESEEARDEFNRCCKVYRFEPCGSWCGCCVTAVVKMRYLPAKCPGDTLLIANYAAVKFLVEGLIKRELGDFGAFQSLKNAGFALLDQEIRHRKGGAAGKQRKGNWMTQRFSQGMR